MAIITRNIYVKRILAAVFFVFIVFISIEYLTPSASADPLHKNTQRSASTAPFKLERSDQTTTTTTTTTTTVPPTTVKPIITAPKAAAPVAMPAGDWVAQCHAWAAEAGIELPPSAIKILERESHCNPNAQNPSSSACGIAQNIRGCGSAGYGYDPISQIKWFHDYCLGRYGGFDGAYQFWLSHHWY